MKRFFMILCAVLLAQAAAAQTVRPNGLRRSSLLNRSSRQTQTPAAPAAGATTAADLAAVPKGTNGIPALAFNQAPVELVLAAYGEQAEKTIIPAPDLPKATITLKSLEGQTLSKTEYLDAIEVTLTMNGIVLEPYGTKFLRAFSRKTVRTQGIPILNTHTNALPEKGRVVSQIIRLVNITASEAQKAIEGFKDTSGLFQVFERNNTILVTDTQENINRMTEIIRELDVASPVLEDVFVRQVKFAVAADVKTALEAIVTESQKATSQESVGPKSSGAPGFSRTPASPVQPRLLNFNRRPGQPQEPAPTPNATMTATVSDADRGMIRGKVQILADERSNKLIIITMKTNMDFFDRVIDTLDVETTPDVKVEVVRLKYADAEEVASMLNDLIGASGGSSSSSSKNAPANASKSTAGNRTLSAARPTTPSRQPTANPTFANSQASKLGELNKDNIKILADKRINGIVVMARTADMKAVKDVIEDMDVKLSQVLIETVIVQVELGDDLTTGVDWIQRGRTQSTTPTGYEISNANSYNTATQYGANPGGWIKQATGNKDDNDNDIYAYFKPIYGMVRGNTFNNGDMLGGGGGSGSGTLNTLAGIVSGASTNGTLTSLSPAGAGLNYFLKSDKLNISAIIQASKSDSRTKVLASPILMTVDNKEATIEATDMIYLFSGYQYSGSSYSGSQVRNYEKRDIGLTVKVTPRINPNGTVVLTVESTFETQGADQSVPNETGGTDPYATVTTRKISSDVSVENRQTIVMGGLTKKTNTESETGIPLLKDIPWIGKWLFGSTSTSEKRSELLVFMTPYVLDDAETAQAEAFRRKKSLSDSRPWEDNGWSASPLADPVAQKEQLRRFKDEWARQDEERKTKLAIEKAKIDRAEKLKKMSKEEREFWIKLNKDELEKELEAEKEESDAEQARLRGIVEDIKKDRLGKAETEIKDSKTLEPNEYQKLKEPAPKEVPAPAAKQAPANEPKPTLDDLIVPEKK